MRKLFFLLFGKQIEMTSHPYTQLEIYYLLIFQTCFFEEQLQYSLTLLLYLFLFLTHNTRFI